MAQAATGYGLLNAGAYATDYIWAAQPAAGRPDVHTPDNGSQRTPGTMCNYLGLRAAASGPKFFPIQSACQEMLE